MAEVFSISGYGFGAATACPTGWQATAKGNCGAPTKGCPKNMVYGKECRSQKALDLQTALIAFGKVLKNAALSSLVADGFIGSKTLTAVQIATEIIPMQSLAAQGITNVKYTSVEQVARDAEPLTFLISRAVEQRGAQVPPSPIPHAQTQTQTQVQPQPQQQTQVQPQPQQQTQQQQTQQQTQQQQTQQQTQQRSPTEGTSMMTWLLLGTGVLVVGFGLLYMLKRKSASRGVESIATEDESLETPSTAPVRSGTRTRRVRGRTARGPARVATIPGVG